MPQVRRRRLLAVASVLLGALPRLVFAQTSNRMHRIGYLIDQPLIEPPSRERAAWLKGLRALGYVEGSNLEIVYRSSESDPTFLADLAAELVAMRVDMIFAPTLASTRAAMNATHAIPIAFIFGADPVQQGFAKSLARPGRNATGITLLSPALEAKRLELVRGLLPHAKRVAVLSEPVDSAVAREREQMRSAARQLGLALELHEVRGPGELRARLDKIAASRVDVLLVLPTTRLIGARSAIAELALERRLPSVMGFADYARLGGLAAYAADTVEQFTRLASYADRLLKGAKAAELPIEQPRRLALSINLATARRLGLDVPKSVLLHADDVIE